MRLATEPAAAKLAARLASPGQKAAICDALQALRESVDFFGDVDRESLLLHASIVTASSNPFFISMQGLLNWSTFGSRLSGQPDGFDDNLSLYDYDFLVEAVVNGEGTHAS